MRFGLLVLAASLPFAPAPAPAALPDFPPYTVGDVADADIVTPVPLVVFDPVRTETLRRAEAQKVPAIFRLLPDAPEQADRALRDAFEARRAEYAADLRARFGHPVPLLTVEVGQPAFDEVTRAFRERHPGFPLDERLVELWAFGNSGDRVLEGWRERLRRLTLLEPFTRADALPAGEGLATAQVRIIEVASTDRQLRLDLVDKQGRNLARTNLALLSKVRRQGSQEATGAEDKAVLEFVAGFLSPNCVFDPELTRQARARRTEAVHVADRYAAGERIVKEGAEITLRVKQALDELRSRLAAEQAVAAAAVERSQRAHVEVAMSVAREQVAATARANRWLWGGLAAVGALCLFSGWRWWKGRRALAPAPPEPLLALIPAGDAAADDPAWRDRALAAEAKAEKATALLRSGLLPQMARWMMNELMQRLLSQRSEMVTSHQRAENEVAELAQRLEQLHAPLEERLRAYEKRIAELEAELASKGQQNLDLIKAKIETTRKKLQVERGEDPLNWN